MKAEPRKRINSLYTKAASVRESRVLLFGNISDPVVQESKRKVEISGRECSVEEREGAYPDDHGATMGMSY